MLVLQPYNYQVQDQEAADVEYHSYLPTPLNYNKIASPTYLAIHLPYIGNMSVWVGNNSMMKTSVTTSFEYSGAQSYLILKRLSLSPPVRLFLFRQRYSFR